jgi:phenylacetate-CoA ligase
MTRAEREAERDRMLVRVYRFAWDHVPFYRSLYERAGLSRQDVRGLHDLARVPLVSKEMMKAAPLRDLRGPRWRVPVISRMTTSGSSGVPFVFYRSLDVLTINAAQLLSYLDLWHVPPRRSVMFILYNADPTIGWRIREGTRFAPFSSTGSVDPGLPAERIAAIIRHRKPDCLIAHPSMVEDVVDTMARSGGNGRSCDAEITFATGGEVLPERLRRKLSVAFPRSRIFDIYNSVETGMMAFECGHRNGLHVNDYAVIIEEGTSIVDGDGSRYFEPVYTNLWSFGTPIIRYTGIEDLLQTGPSECDCGLGGRVITRLIGRESEFVRSPDGKSYSVCIMMSAHADLPGVERFQYVQSDPSALVLRYVPAPGADHAAIARQAEAEARKLLGRTIRFGCEAVERLERSTRTLKVPMLVRS